MTQNEGTKPPAKPVSQATGAKQTGITLGAEFVNMGLLFVAQVLLARYLEPAGRGSYAVCNVFAALLTVIFFLGTDVGLIYFIGSKKFTISQGVANTLIFAVACSALAIGAGVLLTWTPFEFFSKASREAFYLALASIPVTFLSMTLLRCLPQLRQFGWYAALTATRATAYVAAIGVFVILLGGGVNGALVAIIASNAVTLVLVVGFLRWRLGLRWEWPSWLRLGQMLHYGIRYYFGKISNLVNFQVGTLILAMFATESEIGLFSLALAMVMRIEVIPGALTTVLLSRVAADVSGRADLVAQCVRVTALVVGGMLIVGSLVVYPFFLLVLPKFLPAVLVIWVLVPGEWIRSACKLFVPYFIGTNRPGVASAAVALGLVVNVALLAVLLPLLGINGAAASVTGSYIVSSIFLAVAFGRTSGIGFWETWRVRRADWDLAVYAGRRLFAVKQAPRDA